MGYFDFTGADQIMGNGTQSTFNGQPLPADGSATPAQPAQAAGTGQKPISMADMWLMMQQQNQQQQANALAVQTEKGKQQMALALAKQGGLGSEWTQYLGLAGAQQQFAGNPMASAAISAGLTGETMKMLKASGLSMADVMAPRWNGMNLLQAAGPNGMPAGWLAARMPDMMTQAYQAKQNEQAYLARARQVSAGMTAPGHPGLPMSSIPTNISVPTDARFAAPGFDAVQRMPSSVQNAWYGARQTQADKMGDPNDPKVRAAMTPYTAAADGN